MTQNPIISCKLTISLVIIEMKVHLVNLIFAVFRGYQLKCVIESDLRRWKSMNKSCKIFSFKWVC